MTRTDKSIEPWVKIKVLLLSALILNGCAGLTPPLPERPPIPPDLLVLCPDLTPLATSNSPDVAAKIAELSYQYYTCADRHAGLVQAVKP